MEYGFYSRVISKIIYTVHEYLPLFIYLVVPTIIYGNRKTLSKIKISLYYQLVLVTFYLCFRNNGIKRHIWSFFIFYFKVFNLKIYCFRNTRYIIFHWIDLQNSIFWCVDPLIRARSFFLLCHLRLTTVQLLYIALGQSMLGRIHRAVRAVLLAHLYVWNKYVQQLPLECLDPGLPT